MALTGINGCVLSIKVAQYTPSVASVGMFAFNQPEVSKPIADISGSAKPMPLAPTAKPTRCGLSALKSRPDCATASAAAMRDILPQRVNTFAVFFFAKKPTNASLVSGTFAQNLVGIPDVSKDVTHLAADTPLWRFSQKRVRPMP